MTEIKHPTMPDIAAHHCGESDWYQQRAKETESDVQKKMLQDKAELHLRAAAEILTYAPKKEAL